MTDAIDFFAAYAADEVAEEKGAKVTLPRMGDKLFSIARSNNEDYARLITKLVKQNKHLLDSKTPEAKAKSKELMVRVFAETILLGWEGEIKYKDQMLAYSKENAKTLLGHAQFLEDVKAAADNFENYKLVKDEEDEKN